MMDDLLQKYLKENEIKTLEMPIVKSFIDGMDSGEILEMSKDYLKRCEECDSKILSIEVDEPERFSELDRIGMSIVKIQYRNLW